MDVWFWFFLVIGLLWWIAMFDGGSTSPPPMRTPRVTFHVGKRKKRLRRR